MNFLDHLKARIHFVCRILSRRKPLAPTSTPLTSLRKPTGRQLFEIASPLS